MHQFLGNANALRIGGHGSEAIMSANLNPFFQSGKPAINPVWLALWEDGAQLCRLEQDEPVARATPGVQQDEAKKLYFKLWTLRCILTLEPC
jgi:hypothetical protein